MIWLSRTLRALAVLIALAAAIDPTMALMRTDRQLVALIDVGGGENTAAVSRALAESFDVHAGPIAGAAATVLVGDEVPVATLITSGALFAVTPAPAASRIEIRRVSAASAAPSGSKIPVGVTMRAVGMRGRSVVVDLYAGSLAVDSITRAVTQDDESAEIQLALPPAAAGPLTARVVARDAGDKSRTVERHLGIDVRDQRWRVLVADPRPSWASTFVRRALEQDRRFEIVSRIATSTKVGAASGTAPPLADTAALISFDAILVGAPDAMSAADARSLERYARERGGSIVLMLDRVESAPFAPLLGGVALTDVHGVERVKIGSAAANLIATELAVPRDAREIVPLARANIGGKETAAIWQSPLGAGRVIVNGALDAWRYRIRESGGFARFWTDAIGAAAAASPLTLATDAVRVAPGTAFEVRAIVRDAQLTDPARPAPAVELSGPPQFWPTAERGVFATTVPASDTPGNYRLRVSGSTATGSALSADLNYIVAAADRRPEPELLAAWTTSRGGSVLASDVSDVMSRVRTAVNARAERVEAHPMRSVWWIPAFVILLGGEWWIRRRRGER